MLKTIIRKLERKKKKRQNKTLKPFKLYVFFFFFFKLKNLTQNSKVELKRLWVVLKSGTK